MQCSNTEHQPLTPSPSQLPLPRPRPRRLHASAPAAHSGSDGAPSALSSAASPSGSGTKGGGALTFQQAIQRLQEYWASVGCAVMQCSNTEVGAGTMNPRAVERRLCGAEREARRQPLRRQPQQAPAPHPVPGDSEARPRELAGSLPAQPISVRHQCS